MRPWMLVAALVASIAALPWLPRSHLAVAVIWILTFVAAAIRGGRLRALWFNLAFASLVVLSLELHFMPRHEFRYEEKGWHAYVSRHDILGYIPNASQRFRIQSLLGDELVHDVIYTIGADSLRVPPPLVDQSGDQCVLFFGGSFTFGLGVNDHETLPYRLGTRSDGRHRVYNFGFSGYGAHQMLAALQSDFVSKRIDCEPDFVFFQGIAFHPHRSAGLAPWDRHGPRFVLNDEGTLVRKGHFDDDPSLMRHVRLVTRLKRSALFNRIYTLREPVAAERELFLEIVAQAGSLIESRFPRSKFHVLFWDRDDYALAAALEKRGLRVHRVTDIFGAGPKDDLRHYTLHDRDPHPNALALDRLAEYVAVDVIGESDPRHEISIGDRQPLRD